MKPLLVIMLKEPIPGRVKTRLGAEMGMVQAAQWFRAQALSTLRRLDDPRWDIALAVSPDVSGLKSRFWPQKFVRVPQGSGNLGHRMKHVFKTSNRVKTCIIGADIPDIKPHHIAESFAALGSNSAVIGPSTDGGYWLIGLRHGQHLPYTLFDNVRWSSPHAKSDTIKSAESLKWTEVATLDDIDTLNDLARWRASR
ncbi:hypothetical protein EDD53_2702 [Pacificibacter maritimus]|uniref:Glycosyltransferase A (GT-A) superfamily protein (DUF2064 family) n=1 Tax=Pacificibacter maritimus TaxID=762213 RepID=A0A3N4U479_9RHOB|nr:TIGR04282 family arsenosugar biosynthesis glycosyltransferase [Pacificibacter maritimus]RPE63105.1 hypothetical protein EDD53_2702 [Pacificibacter maritimus]